MENAKIIDPYMCELQKSLGMWYYNFLLQEISKRESLATINK